MLGSSVPRIFEVVDKRLYDGPAEVAEHSRDSVLPGQGGECFDLGQIVSRVGTGARRAARPRSAARHESASTNASTPFD